MDLLEGLNPEQIAAVTHKNGPLMIVAGAGTGKTMAITRRIAWLIDQQLAKPENILALTFTDKAAGEMEERVDLLLPYGCVDIQISTFHSFCERILREYGVEIGLPPNFRVLDELDAWLMARADFSAFQLDFYRPLGNPTKYLRALLNHFSRAKDNAITPERYWEFAKSRAADKDATMSEDQDGQVLELASSYHQYQQILLKHDALDFGDLLLYTKELLDKRPAVRKQLADKFQYVLVDEFQDTNRVQYEIIKAISAPQNNLTVVGDDDQAIYMFRGASVVNILQFEVDFPNTVKIILRDNYRSGQEILDRAYNFIQNNNPERLEARLGQGVSKKLESRTGCSGEVLHWHFSTLNQEAQGVARKIQELQSQNPDLHWGDFAILVRANDAAAPFILALERREIPFRFLALRGLYSKSAVLDLLAHLRAINNPFDSPSFYRLLSHPLLDLPPADAAALNQLARRRGKSLYEACQMWPLSNLAPRSGEKIRGLLANLEKFQILARSKRCSELMVFLAREAGYVGYYRALDEPKSQEAFSHLEQFYQRVLSFENRHDDKSLNNFLSEFEFEREAGEEGALSPCLEQGPETVKIMTVHSAKGLEFAYVFVVNMVDQRFPTRARAEAIPLPAVLLGQNPDDQNNNWHLAEERRLFYVALTRAKKGLFLTSAEDYGGARKRKPSRFLTEAGFSAPGLGEDQALESEFSFLRPPEPGASVPLTIHLPKQFSFTQLTSFRACPLQYKFAHVLKIPVFGKWTLSFGKTMHNCWHEFFRLWIERVGGRQGILFAAGNGAENAQPPVSQKELLEIYGRAWQDDWYQDDSQREKYRKKGRDSLLNYYRQIARERPQPLLLEQGFTLKFKDAIIKGRIDRIDQHERGVEIIDYKTGTPKTIKTLEKGDKEQLYLYQLAARDVLGLKPAALTYHYLEDNSKVSFLAEDRELLNLQEQILDRVQKIRDSNFPPTPGFHCRFCDFADICEYRDF